VKILKKNLVPNLTNIMKELAKSYNLTKRAIAKLWYIFKTANKSLFLRNIIKI